MNSLKKLSQTDNELRVGNYMVLFGGRDLAGEYFTKHTRFDSRYTDLGALYVDFEHGMDADGLGNDADNVLGIADWKSAKVDDNGIFVERVLNRRAEYVQYLSQLIDMGVMGTSSAAVPGKTYRNNNGEITDWPLMRDSLTVTPMEPRMVTSNILMAAKALAQSFPASKSLARLSRGCERMTDIEALADPRAVESYLRDLGLGQNEAKALLSRVKGLGHREGEDGDLQRIADALKRRSEAPKQREADAALQRIAEALKRRGQLLAA